MKKIIIANLLNELIQEEWTEAEVVSFVEAGLLTNDTGLVITLPTGDKFNLTLTEA